MIWKITTGEFVKKFTNGSEIWQSSSSQMGGGGDANYNNVTRWEHENDEHRPTSILYNKDSINLVQRSARCQAYTIKYNIYTLFYYVLKVQKTIEIKWQIAISFSFFSIPWRNANCLDSQCWRNEKKEKIKNRLLSRKKKYNIIM